MGQGSDRHRSEDENGSSPLRTSRSCSRSSGRSRGGAEGGPPRGRGGMAGVVIAIAAGTLAGLLAATASAQSGPIIAFESDPIRCTASATELARVIQDCLARVMHPRGLAGSERPEVEARLAAMVCRRARTFEMNRTLADCVRALMYERSGLGRRREAVSAEAAASACRFAASLPEAEQVEACMLRLLYTREGLGYQRTEITDVGAALVCQGVSGVPSLPFPLQPLCRPPGGSETVRFIDECVRRLMYQRDGLGERRQEVTPEAAALACEGALSWWP
jgi:hypothetical protein